MPMLIDAAIADIHFSPSPLLMLMMLMPLFCRRCFHAIITPFHWLCRCHFIIDFTRLPPIAAADAEATPYALFASALRDAAAIISLSRFRHAAFMPSPLPLSPPFAMPSYDATPPPLDFIAIFTRHAAAATTLLPPMLAVSFATFADMPIRHYCRFCHAIID